MGFELSTKKDPHTKSICWKIMIERYGWAVFLWGEKLDDFWEVMMKRVNVSQVATHMLGSKLLLCSEFFWIDFSK